MSLVKNLKRREVEIFGAKRVVRNDNNKKKVEAKIEPEVKKTTKKRTKKNAEV